MKKFLLSFLFAFFTLFSSGLLAQTESFISEIHYDNASGDVNEFIEVYVPDDKSAADYTVYLYNGSNGTVYGTHALSTFTLGEDTPDGAYYTKLISGIQNGAPDGMLLTSNETGSEEIVEFLSYEGALTATAGPAMGLTATDIGVSESGSTPTTSSLQRIDVGETDWIATPDANTFGEENLGNLPVELKSFRVVASNDIVNLSWITINEIDNSHFNILHSTNGFNFRTIGQVDGAGFSTEELEYSFEFRNAINGKNYFQLVQVDFNGDSEKFNIEVVTIEKGNDIKIFPSTADSKITVEGIDSDSNYTIYTITGQSIQSGITSGSINVDNLYNGSYFIQVNGTTLKFFKN